MYARRLVFLFLSRAKFRILYYKQCLDKKCGTQDCWLDDNYILEDVGVK